MNLEKIYFATTYTLTIWLLTNILSSLIITVIFLKDLINDFITLLIFGLIFSIPGILIFAGISVFIPSKKWILSFLSPIIVLASFMLILPNGTMDYSGEITYSLSMTFWVFILHPYFSKKLRV